MGNSVFSNTPST